MKDLDSMNMSADSKLRSRAESLMQNVSTREIEEMSTWEVKKLIHELQVHQVELEMQNDEFHRMQSELEELWNNYSVLFDFAPVAYFTLGRNGIIQKMNITGSRMLNFERKYLAGSQFRKFISPEYTDSFDKFFQALFEAPVRQSIELMMKDRNGREFYVILECVPANEHEGDPYCRAALIDITDRKHAEQKLLLSKELIEKEVRIRTSESERAQSSLLEELKKKNLSEKKLKERVQELEQQITQTQQSGGKLHICVGCSNIGDDNGNWSQPDAFLLKHTRMELVRELCSDCSGSYNAKLFKNLDPVQKHEHILHVRLKEFCDKEIGGNFGVRFWRWVVNSKKSLDPLYPTTEIMELSIQDYIDDTRCNQRIKSRYCNDETFMKAREAFARFGLFPFGE